MAKSSFKIYNPLGTRMVEATRIRDKYPDRIMRSAQSLTWPLYNGLLCNLVRADELEIKAEKSLNGWFISKYEDDADILEKLIIPISLPSQDSAAAINEEDISKFTDVLKEFVSMTPLDSWNTSMLLRVKEKLKAKEKLKGKGAGE